MTIKTILSTAILAASCAAAGAAPSAPPAPLAIFSGAGLNQSVGYSVATDGQRVLIGTATGTAFLYDPFTKQQLAKVTLPDPRFGTSVALQGNTGVVGSRSGGYVYNFANLASISRIDLTPNDLPAPQVGYSVDISGDVVIAGANSDATFGEFSGAAYLFNRTTGAQIAKLIANDAQPSDNFGISVAIDDGIAAVGSVQGGLNNTGAVYRFNAEPGFVGNRQLDRYDQQPPLSQRTFFAYNTDLNGQTIVASEAYGQTFAWSVGGTPKALPNSAFNPHPYADGISVSDDYIAVGFESQGLVRIYGKSGNLLTNLAPPAGSPFGFGVSVAIEGNLLVVGALGNSQGASRAFVYRVQDVLVPEPGGFAVACLGCSAVAFLRAEIGRLHSKRRQGV